MREVPAAARRPAKGLLEGRPGRRVSIVLLTGIGDVVHGLPIAVDLKRDDPERTVRWIAEPAPAEVLRHHPAVDEVVVFRRRHGLAGVMELREALRSPSDVTLNMQRYFKSILPTVFSGAPIRVGLPPSKTRDGVSWFNTHHLPEQPWRHVQDILLDYRGVLGLPVDAPVEWRITFSCDELREQASFFESVRDGGPVTAVVLATANPRKDWPAERYPRLVDALAELGHTVLLVGGRGRRESDAALRVMREARAKPVCALEDSVRGMMWRVAGADLLIAPDTGPLHVAHALGTPVVGLFGHSNPWRVGPWRRFHELVVDRYTDPGAPPDPSAYAPRHGRMELITVEDVLERVVRATTDLP